MYDPAQSTRPYKRVLTPRTQEQPMTEAAPAKKVAMITYVPLEYGDPPENVFAGIRFKANVPTEVPYSHTIEQLLVEQFDTPDGVRSKALPKRVPVPVVLAGNPYFDIDGVRPEKVKPHARIPEDADAYRGYCINWISVSMSADSMDKRWIGEEGLRQRCGCSPADINYLRPFFEARHLECAELDKQRAA